MSWKLTSNSGRKQLEYLGFLSDDSREFVGELRLSSSNLDDEYICTQTLNLFQLNETELTTIKRGFMGWRHHREEFLFQTKSYYYPLVELEIRNEKNGASMKGRFSLRWSTWGIPESRFEMIVDQSCFVDSIASLDSMLRDIKMLLHEG